MDDGWIRLFGGYHPKAKPVRVTLEIAVDNLADGAEVRVADVQLQPGDAITAPTLNAGDLGVQPVDGWQWRNGVVNGAQTVIALADTPAASPCVVDVREAAGPVRAGRYNFGDVRGPARADGWGHTASQGAGIPPHLTERSDVDIPVEVAGRALVTVAFRGLATSDGALEPPAQPAEPPGPATRAHPSWGAFLAAHPAWADAAAAHDDWS